MLPLSSDNLAIVDAHVHIHECYDLSQFLDAAHNNCQNEAHRRGKDHSFTGIILLTESIGVHWYRHFLAQAEKGTPIPGNSNNCWTFYPTEESYSLHADSAAGAKMIIVAGRQIVTKENLEVLALLTDKLFPDGTSMVETIENVRASDGIPAVPWGFGKWSGKRGKLLSDFLLTQKGKDFFLGDNSSRPAFLPYPSQFKLAEKLGIGILPGSDPLPLSTEWWRACSAGFSVMGTINDRTPAQDLKNLLRNPQSVISSFISPEPPLRFFKNQMALRMVKGKAKNPL